MLRLSVFGLIASLGCSAAGVRGGETVRPGQEPAGRAIASFTAVECVDAEGGALAHPARALLVEEEPKRSLLVITRPSYDSLALREPRTEGRALVFQATLQDESGARVLHDYRLPEGGGDGRMAVATEFVEAPAAPGHVSAKVARIVFACRLVKERGAQ